MPFHPRILLMRMYHLAGEVEVCGLDLPLRMFMEALLVIGKNENLNV